MKRINLLFAILVFVGWANATTYLVQPGGAGATWSGIPGTVVDLTVQAQSLNEWYNTQTFGTTDEIWIINGTYTLTDSIVTQTTEKIYGGFTGSEQTVGDRAKGTNAWDFTNATIIDGNATVRGFISSTGALIDGLTIQNCNSGAISNTGAAAKISSSSILQNCIVSTNTTSGTNSAGGVFLTSSGQLSNSYIHHNTNTAQSVGGILIAGTTGGTVSNCTISTNTSTKNGGGLYIDATGTISISNCIISYNTATLNGGGIYLNNGACTINGCTINNNVSNAANNIANGGGGIFVSSSVTSFTLSNSILRANDTRVSHNYGAALLINKASTVRNCLITANVGRTAIFQAGSLVVTYQNCTFANNLYYDQIQYAGLYITVRTAAGTASSFKNCLFYKCGASPITSSNTGGTYQQPSTTYCGYEFDVPTQITVKTGCITQLTSAVPFTDAANGDWSLSPTATVIDAGTTIAAVTTDIIGTIRPQGTAYDMGAYEISFLNTTVTFNTGGTVDSYTSGDVVSRPEGSQLVFMITPDNGQGIKSILFNGVEVKDQLTNLIGSTYYKGGKYTSGSLTETSTLVVEFETDISTALEKVNQFICFSDNQGIKLRGLSIDNQLSVYNITGTLVLKETANTSNVSISLAPGFYMVTVVNAGKNFTQKVIVR